MPHVPSSFATRVIDVHGARGQAWLDDLPARIDACARRWSIEVQEPFAGLSYNWVAPATAEDGAPVVLKLGVPCAELASELAALRAWKGEGAARLIDGDSGEGALLMERVMPGERLSEAAARGDEDATSIALASMQRLHRTPLIADVPTLASWTAGLERAQVAGFAPVLVGRALRARGELLASSPAPVLLHGDLHHANLLSSERAGWLAIDPKGVIGDPAYEPAVFLSNPRDQIVEGGEAAAAFERWIPRRVDQLAAHFDRQRMLGWAFVQAVLAAWWTVEDHAGNGYAPALRFAERVARMR